MQNFSKKITQLILATSLLTFSTISFATNIQQNGQQTLPSQCTQLFNETGNLIADAAQQPGTHPQIKAIKDKLLDSKNKILQMNLADQIKSCNQGLIALNNLKQRNNNE